MNKRRIRRPRHGPEWHIQRKLTGFLEARGWLVEVMQGNAFQKGVPDLFLHHPRWGYRWVDCKNPGQYSFTRDQKRKWPVWDSFGVGIWILTAANQDEYNKLFAPPNWKEYWKDSWGKIPTLEDIDRMLDEIIESE
jgi:hypothetical protein